MKKLLYSAVALIVVVVAAVAILFRPNGGTAVDKSEVVDNFRRTQQSGASTSTSERKRSGATTAEGIGIPVKGVYTYLTSGQEEVKLGPLPSDTRIFPANVTATVLTAGGSDGSSPTDAEFGVGCFDFKLDLLSEHSETTRYCLDGPRLRIDKHQKTIKIGPMSATATLTCDPPIAVGSGAAADSSACNLGLAGGPVTVEAKLDGSTQVGEPTKIQIGGSAIETLPVTLTYAGSGSVTGTWTERFWFSTADWMPVKLERDIVLLGTATIKEHSTLELKSSTPDT